MTTDTSPRLVLFLHFWVLKNNEASGMNKYFVPRPHIVLIRYGTFGRHISWLTLSLPTNYWSCSFKADRTKQSVHGCVVHRNQHMPSFIFRLKASIVLYEIFIRRRAEEPLITIHKLEDLKCEFDLPTRALQLCLIEAMQIVSEQIVLES